MMPHDPEKWAPIFGQDHAQIKHTVIPRLDRGINRRIVFNFVRRHPMVRRFCDQGGRTMTVVGSAHTKTPGRRFRLRLVSKNVSPSWRGDAGVCWRTPAHQFIKVSSAFAHQTPAQGVCLLRAPPGLNAIDLSPEASGHGKRLGHRKHPGREPIVNRTLHPCSARSRWPGAPLEQRTQAVSHGPKGVG
jgi:hypothetical protein